MSDLWITIVSGVIAGGLSGFSWIFFLKQDRDSKEIDNEAKQSDEWHKLYEEAHEELKNRDAKIDELYAQISKQRDCKGELQKENAALSVEITKLRLLMCSIPACPNRKPQTGY